MNSNTKIGIIICDRYRCCAGGKCLRAMKYKEGAFNVYADSEVELVGFTTCNGCPGGNIEYAGEEMVKNGAEVFSFSYRYGRWLQPENSEFLAIVQIWRGWQMYSNNCQ